MTSEVLYDDGRVRLDQDGVTLRRYFFPSGTSKRIPYAQIRTVESRGLDWLSGRGRAWGGGLHGRWLPLDLGRFRRHTLVVLDVGARFDPAFTPDDPDTVLRLLGDHVTPAA